MSQRPKTHLESFHFRDLHSQVHIGTASDRYAGWLGQIYSQDRYKGRITKRAKIIGAKSFIEEVLPVDSVEEYFEHFRSSKSISLPTDRSWTIMASPPRTTGF